MKPVQMLLALAALFAGPMHAAPAEFTSTTIGVGVVVGDLERSLAFYTGVIGMIETGGFSISEGFSKRSGLAGGLPTQVKVLRLGEGEEATQWKLMSFGGKAKPLQNEYIHNHTGMRYITIQVRDLTPILARIRRHQVKLLGETPVPLGPDNHFVLIQDPDGTFIELIGPMK